MFPEPIEITVPLHVVVERRRNHFAALSCLPRGPSQRTMRPAPLYILTWTSVLFSVFIFVMSVLDLGLWMNMSAAVSSTLYHIAVLVLSARSPEVPRYGIFTSMATAGCASILVFAWFAALAMTILALAIGRENFPGPPPLVPMAFPVHVALIALTAAQLFIIIGITRLSGYPHILPRAQSAFQRRIALRPLSSHRRFLNV
ncbi:hypothetical protein B0H17DRAFT_1200959 [Mycena rosella]|uniref:Uncharacterized protein n=1 Tax=Mycena rosella TaxID=1033263 RepID=A0AAD7GK02_MYCRO|nr:hypothetical protein B0H17DRAFT_1200959 [Mycena rosella]